MNLKDSFVYMILFAALSVAPVFAHAQEAAAPPPPPPPEFNAGEVAEFYLIDEGSFKKRQQNIDPAEELQLIAQKTVSRVINLLQGRFFREVIADNVPKYDRLEHFGRWINDPTDDTCMNTRAKILVRDSVGPIVYRNEKNCVVESGKWDDPYSGEILEFARQVQIDHMVPLKNAYVSGAWKWDFKARCLFANYLGKAEHLVSVKGRENMSKGDRSPEAYMPSNTAHSCQYLRNWMMTKLIWRLQLRPAEIQFIQSKANELNCSANEFKFSRTELEQQRRYMTDNLNYCLLNRRTKD